MKMARVALLDDYQNVAMRMADWKSLPADTEVVAFPDHIADQDKLAARLADFDVVMATREGRWQTSLGLGLNGKTLGVLGLGTLGSRVTKMGRACEMEVLAWSQNLTAERAAEVGASLVPKDELLARSDFVSIHLVLGERSRGLIGGRELGTMKRSAYLVNTSRGPIVDEAALVRALREGTIAGAGLDVFDEEPLPLDHPFRELPSTVITPHLGYVTEETYRIFYGQALEDVQAFLRGAPVRVLKP